MHFFGYSFNFLTSLSGPFCFFSEYIDFIHGYRPKRENTTTVPISHKYALAAVRTVGAACCLLFVGHANRIFDKNALGDSKWYAENSFLYVLGFVAMVCYAGRAAFYVEWLLCDAACDLAGFNSTVDETGT